MSSAPVLTVDQVQAILPDATNIEYLDKGGQKIVFTAAFAGARYAVKFMARNASLLGITDPDTMDDVTARAVREVETMRQCQTPHLVKIGPIGLKAVSVDNQDLIFFTEEFIEGKNLKAFLQETGPLSVNQIQSLAYHISEAIAELWSHSKVHRDIKPGNIMRHGDRDDFVLLDMGLVLDLEGASLSQGPVGTPIYSCPEQRDFRNRRSVMNFRSDLFLLGIVLYEMATGKHPFVTTMTQSTFDVMVLIEGNYLPPAPTTLRSDLPAKLDEIIMRLLAKRPSLRYRTMAKFHEALAQV